MTSLRVVDQKAEAAPTEKQLISVMERYDFSAMVASSILAEAGYTPQVIRNPEQLLETLTKQTPAALFYDLDIENEEDKKYLKKVKESFPELPLILINWVGQEIDKEKITSEYQLLTIVQRPFSRREVLQALDKALQ